VGRRDSVAGGGSDIAVDRRWRVALLVGHVVLNPMAAAADNPGEIFELPSVDVVGTAPLPGLGTPLRDVPANVQMFGQGRLMRSRTPTLTQFLEQNGNSVATASGQGNAFEQSLDFRGFAASPLLGQPQGLSVFQDGVRINEAFGDVVNWDLLPQSAISSVQLIPGTVPAFGLNTLGGALAIYTKSGAQYPGAAVEVSGGSFRRRSATVEAGGARGAFDAFATAHVQDDAGYAQHNESRVRQFFGKAGYEDEANDVDLSLTLADNRLAGAQTLPVSFLDKPREAYTYPDVNENRLALVTLRASRVVGEAQLVDANAHYRRYRNVNVSSNVDDAFGTTDPDTGALDTTEATNDRARIDEASYGAAMQWTIAMPFAGGTNQLAIGASANGATTQFTQASQPAAFASDRATIGTGDFVQTTRARLRNTDAGVYVASTLAFADWSFAASGRYDSARATIEDRTGTNAALNGTHRFARLDPAVGFTFHPSTTFTAYANYSEGMRAPTPIELTCSDPAAPCKLPNEFLADPPLREVVSATLEAGARGRSDRVQWSAAVYRTDLRDDLAFIASGAGASNAGYFQNVGRTRRQGVELGATIDFDPFTLTLRYDAIDARYRSSFTAASPNNSAADDAGGIEVRAGDRLPGIPAQSLKTHVDWAFHDGAWIALTLFAASSQYAVGDENNADRHGKVPGYFVVNLDAQYALTPRVTLFAGIDNLLDRRYASFGIVGENVFTGPGRTFGPAAGIAPVPEQFRAPGAPRSVFAGVRVRLEPDASR
jgi:outer membrane receptor protein involved in Fe transport